MPIRLKSLELHGYKTFATKSEFHFAGGITAIVGPNGSGKSNIADAIRWVLGEQSYGLLRGKKTEDMIFSGSELRPRAGMASAVLIFDNSDGWLPIEFSEVAIGRRAYRDGENEYLLNGQRVRLKDLDELLARCGLSERTYTIIGQGLIDSALSLKAEERRALFEEAAGIGLYRSKREDALRRLETTRRNLDRVQDILAELRPRLRSLERQAQRARDYDQVKADLKEHLRTWYGYHWHAAQENLVRAINEAETQAEVLTEMQSGQEGLDQGLLSLRQRISDLRARLGTLQKEFAQLRSERESLVTALAVADERSRSLAEQRDAFQKDIPALESELAAQEVRIEAARADLERAQAQVEEAEREIAAAQATLESREADRSSLEEREQSARQVLNSVSSQMAETRARLAAHAERQLALTAVRDEQRASLSEQDIAQASARTAADRAEGAFQQAQAERRAVEEALSESSRNIASADAAVKEAGQSVAAKRSEEERLSARAEVLEQAERELNGYAEGTRLLLSAIRDQRLSGARGALSERLNVPAEMERAVAGALGTFLDAIVLENEAPLDSALSLLDNPEGGRASLLPLDRLAPTEVICPLDDPDCLGVCSELVGADPDIRPAVELLLGRTLVARNAGAARRFLPHIRADATIVTLKGEVFHAAGPVLAGRDSVASSLTRGRERRDLRAQLEATQQERRLAEDALREAEARAASLQQRHAGLQARLAEAHAADRSAQDSWNEHRLVVERLERELKFLQDQLAGSEAELRTLGDEEARASSRLSELEAERARAEDDAQAAAAAKQESVSGDLPRQLAHWQTQLAVATRGVQNAQARLAELDRSKAALAASLTERRDRIERLAAEAQSLSDSLAGHRDREAGISTRIDALRQQIEPLEAELSAASAEQDRLETGQAVDRATLHSAEHRHAQLQLEWARKQEEVEHLRRRIEEDFGLVEFDYADETTGPTPLPLGELVEKLTRVEELPEGLEEALNRRRGQLRRMGAINPEAQAEYTEVKERVEFMSTQVEDLHQAEAQLREVIAEMDLLMEREFRKTFDAVSVEFREAFSRLFNGGTAKLVLTDPDNLTVSGIDIQARLPGKRTQGLSSLSGGERSLTACALVFALLKVSPTPFCVLDEVDAMLDESNVTRYREMLSELAEKTQFIVITHNRHTVQAAEVIYGISMGADSASQTIGLKLEEAAKQMKAA